MAQIEKMMDEIKGMTVLELNELVKALEDEFGVSAAAAAPVMMAGAVPELDLYHPWELTPDAAIEQAQRCEAAALDLDQRLNNSEGSSVATHANLHVYGNSHGFLGAYPSTSHSVSCAVLGQDENGMQRDYWYTSARDFAELRPVEEVGREAGERASGLARWRNGVVEGGLPRRLFLLRAVVVCGQRLGLGDARGGARYTHEVTGGAPSRGAGRSGRI